MLAKRMSATNFDSTGCLRIIIAAIVPKMKPNREHGSKRQFGEKHVQTSHGAPCWTAVSGPQPVCAPPAHAAPAKALKKADRVIVAKAERTLTLMHKGAPLKVYKVALGRNPLGPKRQQGDKRTPEGNYVIDYRNPKSSYHLSLHISYPDRADRKAARKRGVSPGGDIMIHGLPNGMGWLGITHRVIDWTDGCIAVTNDEIQEIWRLVPNGTPIEIRP